MTRHLLVIGAQRCGTTYLHFLLEAHPAIAMARPARPEPKVFLSSELSGRGRDWYRSTYFSHRSGESVLGEKSTSYMEDSAAATRASSMLGEVDVVVVLRDPVARAISNWQFSTAHGLENRPLNRALRENLQATHAWDATKTSVSPYAYLERGRYAQYLRPWYAHFSGRVHVFLFEELIGSARELAKLYRALAVDPDFRPTDLGQQINSSSDAAPHLEPELATSLRDYFQDSDVELTKLLGRDLPWAQQCNERCR